MSGLWLRRQPEAGSVTISPRRGPLPESEHLEMRAVSRTYECRRCGARVEHWETPYWCRACQERYVMRLVHTSVRLFEWGEDCWETDPDYWEHDRRSGVSRYRHQDERQG